MPLKHFPLWYEMRDGGQFSTTCHFPAVCPLGVRQHCMVLHCKGLQYFLWCGLVFLCKEKSIFQKMDGHATYMKLCVSIFFFYFGHEYVSKATAIFIPNSCSTGLEVIIIFHWIETSRIRYSLIPSRNRQVSVIVKFSTLCFACTL